jgi:glycosyltransferase involved in cell wall biosynthesis
VKKGILHMTTFLQGGAGLVLKNLAIHQRKMGHQVTVVASKTSYDGYCNYPDFVDALQSESVEVHLVDSLFKRDQELNRNVEVYLSDIFDRYSFDLIHTHSANPSRIAKRVLKRKELKLSVIQTMQGWGQNKTRAQEDEDIQTLNQLDGVVTVSQASRDLLVSKGVAPSLLEVIPNAVESSSKIVTHEKDHGLLQEFRRYNEKIIGCFGTICERKNQTVLLEAVAELKKQGQSVGLLLLGEKDPTYFIDPKLIQGLEESKSLLMLGYKANARAFFKYLDLYCLPSRSEGLPLSLLESFSESVLSLGSRILPTEEILEHGKTGFLFDSTNVIELANLIRTCLELSDREKECMTHRAYKRFEQEFSLDALLGKYANYYEKVSLSRS